MFNPSDLEGEVDHSFFDSDCDDGSLSRDGAKAMEKGLEAGKDSPSAHERLHAKQTENTKTGWSPRIEETKMMPVENDNTSGAKTKENSCQKEEVSGASSVVCALDKVIHNCFKDEENSNLHSKRPEGTFMALLAKASERDYQNVYSPNESEEEETKHSGTKGRKKLSSKKHIRNRRTQSLSPTSSEASVDANSESSFSSSNKRGSADPSVLPRPSKSSVSTGVRRTRADSAGSRDVASSHTEESDDTVTDVSSLSSPDSSLLRCLDPKHSEDEEGSLKEQQKESVASSGPSNAHPDEDSGHDVDACSLSSDSQLGGELVHRYSAGRNRKNYSFTNDEVRSIDHENQRLLRELSRLSAGSRPGSTVGRKACVSSNSPLIRLSHSALNRQREQRRIERENLAFLKRLESIKPTRSLKRSEQLADYQRLVTYGAPSSPICVSTTKKGSSNCRMPSGSRSLSSASHTSRGVSTTADSSRTSRSKKLSAARPAWC